MLIHFCVYTHTHTNIHTCVHVHILKWPSNASFLEGPLYLTLGELFKTYCVWYTQSLSASTGNIDLNEIINRSVLLYKLGIIRTPAIEAKIKSEKKKSRGIHNINETICFTKIRMLSKWICHQVLTERNKAHLKWTIPLFLRQETHWSL